jgi:superoxide oxidase
LERVTGGPRGSRRPGASVEALLTAHRSTGVFVWAVVIARVALRSYFAELPPFPASMPKLQQWAAKLSEYGLYVLLLLQPLTGLASVLFRGRPFVLFGWQMPALLTPNKTIYETLDSAHELGAAVLLALIGLHAAAALFHGVVLRDGVLQRMLPWTAR